MSIVALAQRRTGGRRPTGAPNRSTTAARPDRGEQPPRLRPWKLQKAFPGQLQGVACLDARRCVAGGADGFIARTRNGGDTWMRSPHPLIAGVADVSCSGVCVAVGSNGVGPASISSPDQGRTWTAGGAPVGIAPDRLAVVRQQQRLRCRRLESTTGPLDGAASWTSDGGHTWSASTIPSGILVPSVVSCRGQLCVAVGTYSRSIGPPIILSELVVSTDGGRTWTKRTAPTPSTPPSSARTRSTVSRWPTSSAPGRHGRDR